MRLATFIPRALPTRWPARCAGTRRWPSTTGRPCARPPRERRRDSRRRRGVGAGRGGRCSRRCPTRARSTASASTTPPTRPRPAPSRPSSRSCSPRCPTAVAPPGGPVAARRWCGGSTTRASCASSSAPAAGSAGYAVADDVSARDLQRREPQWTRAKGADDFCPWGPWITTADEVPDPQDLRLRTWVNGELRQDSTTADLIFGVADARRTSWPRPARSPRRPHPHRHARAASAWRSTRRVPQRRRRRADRDRGPGRDRAPDRGRDSASARVITLSMRPYSTASSALKKRSRSMSSWICSTGWPVCSA